MGPSGLFQIKTRRAVALLLWFLLSGCIGKHLHPAEADDHYGGLRDMQESPTVMAKTARPARYGAPPMPPPPPGEDTAEPEPASAVEPADRMVHYNGYVELRAARPSELIEEIATLVESLGGYVERSSNARLTARVPVDSFRSTFAEVLGLGEVIRKSMTARDVTDAHHAADLRLRIATKTRARLQQLLARTKEEKDKLAILREIQRLTEQIDRLERQTRTLASLASMSRLTVEAIGQNEHTAQKQRPQVAGFEWIDLLSAFDRSVAESNSHFDLEVPDGLVELGDVEHFQAESADGVVVWTSRLDNEPTADATFWMAALQNRIGSEFANVATATEGSFVVLRLEEPSKEPYIYTIALRVVGDEIELVEVYFPDAAAEQRHRAAIVAVLVGRAS